MTYEEIKTELANAYKRREEHQDHALGIYKKINDLKEQEYPFAKFLEEERELNKDIRKYEKLLKECEDKSTSRQRSPYFDFMSDDEHSLKCVEERKTRICPNGMYLRGQHPKIDNKAKSLQEALVQCCIDWILENDDHDIDRVDFCADALQLSANYGKWEPETDSHISVESLVWDDDINGVVREMTGEFC